MRMGHKLDMVGVTGSIPVAPTIESIAFVKLATALKPRPPARRKPIIHPALDRLAAVLPWRKIDRRRRDLLEDAHGAVGRELPEAREVRGGRVDQHMARELARLDASHRVELRLEVIGH